MGKRINLPTMLTVFRMILAVLFTACFLGGRYSCDCSEYMECISSTRGFYIVALVIFIIAALTDKIDGDYARKHNQVTDLGKFLDPLADKMLVDAAFLCLVTIEMVPMWVFIIIIWRDLAVDGMRMMLAQEKTVLAASIWGKIKTTVQMVALIVFMLDLIIWDIVTVDARLILSFVGIVLMLAVVVLTIVSGWEIVAKGLKALK